MSFLILPLSIAYLELAIIIMTPLSMNIAGPVLCAVAFGLILNLICFLLKNNKWLVFVFAEALSVFFTVEYFTNATYSVFMSPMSIIAGAGGVAAEFSDAVIDVVVGGLINILIFQVPSILILIFNLKGDRCIIERKDIAVLISILAIVFFQSMGIEAVYNYNPELYTYAYSYDNAVKNFGVLTAVRLEAKYLITGVPSAPIIQSLPEEEVEEPELEKEYSYNRIEYDFGALKELAPNETYKNMLEYVQAQSASKKNEYTGLFEGKNLILICAESFSTELIREDINPTLYRMATKGIVVEDYYQPFWGGSTTTGEASILLGRIPTDGVNTMQDILKTDNSYTIASRLLDEDYYTAAIHPGHFDYYDRYITHPSLGFTDFYSLETGLDIKNTWPGDDLAAIDFSFDLYKDKAPFCIYYMSYSGHGLYNYTGNEMSIRNKDYIESMDLPYSEKVRAYFACNYNFELSLSSLIGKLDEAGELENTVIVISTDHYPYALQRGDAWKNTEDFLSELYGYAYTDDMTRDHSSLIIWSPCLEELEETITVSGPSYSVDILPTLLNLFGIDYDSRLYVGRDLLSESEPLAIWINGSWKSDKGYFNAINQSFTTAEGENVSDEYINTMKLVVAGKIDFSRKLTANDFFAFLRQNM